jgi:membrane-bound ClpP family serine protease
MFEERGENKMLQTKKKHSKIGLASFAIGIVGMILMIYGVVNPSFAAFLFSYVVIALCGLVMSFISFFFKRCRKLFSIWGLVLNGIYILILFLMFTFAIWSSSTI